MFTRKLIIVQIFLFILASTSFGQVLKDDLKNDLIDYRKILSTYYLGFPSVSNDFDIKVSEVLASRKDTLSLEEVTSLFYEINSVFQDLHLSVSAPFSKTESKFFPFLIRKFDEKFYISYNQSNDSTWTRGIQILKINQKPINEIYLEILDLIYTDGNKSESKNYYAENRFGSYYEKFFGITDTVKIEFIKNDSILTKNVAFVSGNELVSNTTKRYPNALRKNLKLQSLDSLHKIQLLDVTSFSGTKRFKCKLKNRFKTLNSEKTEALILDLRGNGGGSISNMQSLVSYLNFSNFKIYDSVLITKPGLKKVTKRIGYLPARFFLKKQKDEILFRDYRKSKGDISAKKKYHFEGDLYVLVNPATYSAASFAVNLLKKTERAIFIGTNVGGANWGSYAGMFLKQTLPRTDFKLRIPLMKLVYNSEGLNHSNFVVLPDFYVAQGFEDFIKRDDTLIKFTQNLILNKQ